MTSLKFCFVLIAVLAADVSSNGVAPLRKLSNGKDMPGLGLGTWLGFAKAGGPVLPTNDDVEKAVEHAIDVGYRLIDTARIYDTEEQVGRAINKKIAEGVVKREDLFVVTKLWNDRHEKDEVVPALKESLKKLNLDYVDLYLIHWPISTYSNNTINEVDYLDTWKSMIEARDQGLARSIGVSNFNVAQLNRLISLTHERPAVLQVEINLNLQQPALLAYCRDQNITIMGYTPFGSLFHNKAKKDAPPPRTDDQAMLKIADKYNKTVPQIALRYMVELGVIPIPKSTTNWRIDQNIDIFDFALTKEESDQLRAYDVGYRTIPVKMWADSPYYPFEKN